MPEFLLIALSAVLLHAALWYSHLFFWLSFFWLVPLFYIVLTREKMPGFLAGCLWGVLFFSLHLQSVINLLFTQAHGLGRLIVPVFLVAYCATHSGIWFALARATARLAGNGTVVRALSWILWTYFFIVWIPAGSLWICGQFIGYPLAHPLLALAQDPRFLRLLSVVGGHVLVVSLISFAMSCAMLLVTRKLWAIFALPLCLAPFLYGFFVPWPEEQLPEFFKKIGYVKPPDEEQFSRSLDAAQEIYYRMRALLERRPEVTCIVMPELSYRFALNEHNHVLAMWNDNALRDDVQLLIGACRSQGKKIYNSLYWVQEGRVKRCYDKSRLMPLAEYVPAWCKKVPFLRDLFLHDNEFCAMPYDGQVFEVDTEVIMEPCICSELFFGKHRSDQCRCVVVPDNKILLSVLNDVVLCSHMQHLMLLWDTYQAIEYKQARLHVGYQEATWMTPSGCGRIIP